MKRTNLVIALLALVISAAGWSCIKLPPEPENVPVDETLGVPQLLSPLADNEPLISDTTDAKNLVFRWRAAQNAKSYAFQIDSKTLTSDTNPQPISAPDTSLSRQSLSEATYFWRVRAVSDAKVGQWAAPRKVVVTTYPPKADFLGTSELGQRDTTASITDDFKFKITFIDYSDQGTNPMRTWKWDFGDGTPEETFDRSGQYNHTYKTKGCFSVKLEVSDGERKHARFKENYIRVYNQYNPTACFTFKVLNSAAPFRVAFTDSSHQGLSGDIDVWEWDFGDGSAKSTQKNPTHEYAMAGTYLITLVVEAKIDDFVFSDTARRNIIIP
jgi:PKD repeat protein